ncbi:MAG: hypothetical protein HQL51_09630 [Magnetococcales bacterium]|nr:hypothetical protein [Magnetococcales bacterium]
MGETLQRLCWLIPLAPWLAALWIGVGYGVGRSRGEAGEKTTARAALGGMGASLLLLLALDLQAWMTGAPPGEVDFHAWLESGPLRIGFTFTLDRLALAMATLSATISLLTTRFSVHYLHREEGFQRFFAILSLFNGALLLLFLSGNAVLAFAAWEVMGVSSWLLIGYAFDRPVATTNAVRAFVANRFGDAGFLVGVALSVHWLGTVEWKALLSSAERLDTMQSGLIAGGLLLAALAKSGQFPFAAWIARALEGPTPSSAIFYGSMMVHAGVFLTLRLEPLILHAPLMMALLFLMGGLTVGYALVCGWVQSDVKSLLLFSTQLQVGLMFMACGLGWFELAGWHLALHALWRSWQFLTSPEFMHGMVRPAWKPPGWVQGQTRLHAAALQRFWLEPMADALLVRPTESLGRDAQSFDDRLVNRMVGLPGTAGAVASLADWEERTEGGEESWDVSAAAAGGRGVMGRLLERISHALHWFEERLVLRGGGEGLLSALHRVGVYFLLADRLLSRPRYLMVFIAVTFIVIL